MGLHRGAGGKPAPGARGGGVSSSMLPSPAGADGGQQAPAALLLPLPSITRQHSSGLVAVADLHLGKAMAWRQPASGGAGSLSPAHSRSGSSRAATLDCSFPPIGSPAASLAIPSPCPTRSYNHHHQGGFFKSAAAALPSQPPLPPATPELFGTSRRRSSNKMGFLRHSRSSPDLGLSASSLSQQPPPPGSPIFEEEFVAVERMELPEVNRLLRRLLRRREELLQLMGPGTDGHGDQEDDDVDGPAASFFSASSSNNSSPTSATRSLTPPQANGLAASETATATITTLESSALSTLSAPALFAAPAPASRSSSSISLSNLHRRPRSPAPPALLVPLRRPASAPLPPTTAHTWDGEGEAEAATQRRLMVAGPEAAAARGMGRHHLKVRDGFNKSEGSSHGDSGESSPARARPRLLHGAGSIGGQRPLPRLGCDSGVPGSPAAYAPLHYHHHHGGGEAVSPLGMTTASHSGDGSNGGDAGSAFGGSEGPRGAHASQEEDEEDNDDARSDGSSHPSSLGLGVSGAELYSPSSPGAGERSPGGSSSSGGSGSSGPSSTSLRAGLEAWSRRHCDRGDEDEDEEDEGTHDITRGRHGARRASMKTAGVASSSPRRLPSIAPRYRPAAGDVQEQEQPLWWPNLAASTASCASSVVSCASSVGALGASAGSTTPLQQSCPRRGGGHRSLRSPSPPPPLLHPTLTRAASPAPGPIMPAEDGVLVLEPPPLPSPDPITGKSPFFASCSPLYSPRPAFPARASGGGGGGSGNGSARAGAL